MYMSTYLVSNAIAPCTCEIYTHAGNRVFQNKPQSIQKIWFNCHCDVLSAVQHPSNPTWSIYEKLSYIRT